MLGEQQNTKPIVLGYPIKSENFRVQYKVLEVIREAEDVSHLVVEDIHYKGLYYLKRMIIREKATFERYLNYYKCLEEFTKSKFSPVCMVKLWMVGDSSLDEEGSYELLLYFEWGSPIA